MQKIAVITIACKNYLAQVRTLFSSVNLADTDKIALFVDSIEGYINPDQESYTIWTPTMLTTLPGTWEHFAFKYNITELNTAVKPFFIQALFEQGYEYVLYFDPDIFLYEEQWRLLDAFDKGDIVLTPHLLIPLPDDGKTQSEQDILRSGTYNLGFIGLKKSPLTTQMLQWWCQRLFDRCRIKPELGLFVDQRWIDLVPALFPSVNIVTDAGWNVAYWNIGQRVIVKIMEHYTASGYPLLFFHYSGYNPREPSVLSKHQDRYLLTDLSVSTQTLFDLYGKQLLANGFEAAQKWPYTYDYFESGQPISVYARESIWLIDPAGKKYHNPFNEQYEQHLKYPAPKSRLGLINPVALSLYALHPELHSAYRDPINKDELNFAAWLSVNYPQGLALRPPTAQKDGINIVGYAYSETGVGESCRGFTRAMLTTDQGVSIFPLVPNDGTRKSDTSVEDQINGFVYDTNLFVVNADMTYQVRESLPHHAVKDHLNIGFWTWETSTLPRSWHVAAKAYDQIWVPSHFVRAAVQKITDKPVRVVPYPVAIEKQGADRQHYGIDTDEFVVLFMFDAFSVVERKNPLAAIEAFKRAAIPNGRLVIKSSNLAHFPTAQEQLEAATKDVSGVTLIDEYWDRAVVNQWVELCDVYLSLHCSEGFGLTLAEAMSLERPVIATHYGGVTDFLNKRTGYPVKYQLVRLEQDYGPYLTGNVWAAPDVDEAARCLVTVYNNPVEAHRRAKQAAQFIREYCHPQVIGKEITKLLKRNVKS